MSAPVTDERLEELRDAYAYFVANRYERGAGLIAKEDRIDSDKQHLSIIEELQAFRAALKLQPAGTDK